MALDAYGTSYVPIHRHCERCGRCLIDSQLIYGTSHSLSGFSPSAGSGICRHEYDSYGSAIGGTWTCHSGIDHTYRLCSSSERAYWR